MRCNNLHIIFLLFFLTTLFGCGGCKNNGNEKPNINCNLSFNADSTQLITYYEVSDDYGIDYIIRTIYIGDSISSKIEYLKSKEIYTLLDEVHISEMFQMQYKFYDCSERHFLVLLIRY